MKRYIVIGLVIAIVVVASLRILLDKPEDGDEIESVVTSQLHKSDLKSEEIDAQDLDKPYVMPFSGDQAVLSMNYGGTAGFEHTTYVFSKDAPQFMAVSNGTVVDKGYDSSGGGYYFVVFDENDNYVTYKFLESEEVLPEIGTEIIKGIVVSSAGNSGNTSAGESQALLGIQINTETADGPTVDFETLL